MTRIRYMREGGPHHGAGLLLASRRSNIPDNLKSADTLNTAAAKYKKVASAIYKKLVQSPRKNLVKNITEKWVQS